MGNMMAYKMTMFMVFFNLGMGIANYMGTLFFPDGIAQYSTYDMTASLSVLDWFSSVVNTNTGVLGLIFTGGLLALFAFSLLIPTIWVVATFFSLNGFITILYLDQLNLPEIFSLPIKIGVVIITFIGISQYMARSTVQGA